MFKNISRKQKRIDELQKYKAKQEEKQKLREEKKQQFGFSDLLDSDESNEKIFDSQFVKEIHNGQSMLHSY